MKLKQSLALATLGLLAAPCHAVSLTVTVENLTRGVLFTPLLVAAHTPANSIFSPGHAASMELQALAEGGDFAPLESALMALGATQSNNPSGGPLAPGHSTTTMLNTDGTDNTALTIAAMLLPTNDGFVALNSQAIPAMSGTYVWYAKAWDAGTEANNELRGDGALGFPVPGPLDPQIGTGGTGAASDAEGFVHIHRGVLGDTDPTGGISDIDSTLHRWLNPVAKITLMVMDSGD